jgi:hypothetical protein
MAWRVVGARKPVKHVGELVRLLSIGSNGTRLNACNTITAKAASRTRLAIDVRNSVQYQGLQLFSYQIHGVIHAILYHY